MASGVITNGGNNVNPNALDYTSEDAYNYEWQRSRRPFSMSEALCQLAHSMANANVDKCHCRGGGWLLTDYDTHHQCPYHYRGQEHPEYY